MPVQYAPPPPDSALGRHRPSSFRRTTLAAAGAILLLLAVAAVLERVDPPPAARAQSGGSQCLNSAALAAYATATAATVPIVADCDVLLAARDTLRGTTTLNWSKDLALDSWTGIVITSDPGNADPNARHLITTVRPNNVYLPSGTKLNGTIPTALGNLSALESLSLEGNQLTGSIPPELGQLSKLTYLNLSYNQLTGSLPKELGRLSQTGKAVFVQQPACRPSAQRAGRVDPGG